MRSGFVRPGATKIKPFAARRLHRTRRKSRVFSQIVPRFDASVCRARHGRQPAAARGEPSTAVGSMVGQYSTWVAAVRVNSRACVLGLGRQRDHQVEAAVLQVLEAAGPVRRRSPGRFPPSPPPPAGSSAPASTPGRFDIDRPALQDGAASPPPWASAPHSWCRRTAPMPAWFWARHQSAPQMQHADQGEQPPRGVEIGFDLALQRACSNSSAPSSCRARRAHVQGLDLVTAARCGSPCSSCRRPGNNP